MNNKIQVYYQDDHYIIVEKPSKLLVHPYKESTDTTSLLKVLKAQEGHYLYPVHRLDRPVSGLIMFGKSSQATKEIKERWHHDSTQKKYLTLCRRQILESGEFCFDLSNDKKIKQAAKTLYRPLQVFENYTFLEVEIKTGRKHQIRRHFSRRVYNLVGDTMYGKGVDNNYFREHFNLDRIFLHAHHLAFYHPFLHKNLLFHSPLPQKLQNILDHKCKAP